MAKAAFDAAQREADRAEEAAAGATYYLAALDDKGACPLFKYIQEVSDAFVRRVIRDVIASSGASTQVVDAQMHPCGAWHCRACVHQSRRPKSMALPTGNGKEAILLSLALSLSAVPQHGMCY